MEYNEDEYRAFEIVRKIVSSVVNPDRVARREMKSYMAITLDDSPRMTICRIYIGKKNYVGLLNERKVETRVRIQDLEELHNCGRELKMVTTYYATKL